MKIYKTLHDGTQIVEYEESLASGLADMWNKSRENWGIGSELETKNSQLDYYRNASFINVYAALRDGGVIGLCSLAKYFKDADALYIQVLNVVPDYIGKGIGKELVLMSVARTIELGCPRLMLHTWPGNVKAVPLYKKCGFMWEDNSESTSLFNFIPTVLAQDLFKPFFAGASWYDDSAASLEVKPDGVSKDNFEFFTYEWRKGGAELAVTFEKFGRRVCRVETADFVIELAADNHELAYGFDYTARFLAVNKTGKPLSVTFEGKNDGNISFSHFSSAEVKDRAESTADFTVNKPAQLQDPRRQHPCVLANVGVNGMSVEMGLGIEAKPPLAAEFHARRGAAVIGQKFDAYLSFSSALLTDAAVGICLPENEYVSFGLTEHSFDISALGKHSVKLSAEVLKTGHAAIPVQYEITLADGRKASFSKVLDIVNHGLAGAFCADTEKSYMIANGAYRLEVGKNSNYATLYHALRYELDLEFPMSKLGKPYDDEFSLAKPTEVNFAIESAEAVMELTYASVNQENIAMTVIFTLTASGIITRRHRIFNNGGGTRRLFLNETAYTGANHNSAFRYNNRFTASDRHLNGDNFSAADASLLEENWVFTDNKPVSCGVCWPMGGKPTFRWGDGIVFEHELNIEAGGSAETPPITACVGLFGDYAAFRNFALGTYSPYTEPTVEPLELIVNGHNPIFSGEEGKVLAVKLRNNRNIVYEGELRLTADFLAEGETQENPEELVEENIFTIKPESMVMPEKSAGVGVITLQTDFPTFKTETSRTLFFPSREADFKVNMTSENGILTVSNGMLAYKCDPAYFAGIYSLTDARGNEWLMSKHPDIGPFEWWNPFIGGMRLDFDKMNSSNALKETASAKFTEAADTFGNIWQGIKTSVTAENNKEFRGLTYEQYYLTMTGIPVLCCFTRFVNNSGAYLQFGMGEAIFCNNEAGGGDLQCEARHLNKSRKFTAGNTSLDYRLYDFARFTSENGARLHLLPNTADSRCDAYIEDDSATLIHFGEYDMGIPNGASETTRPTFLVFAEVDLSADSLRNLKRVIFDEKE